MYSSTPMAVTSLLALSTLTLTASACSKQGSTQITFYGFPDNDPPGPGTAFNCGGRNNVAGGSGTFNDPVTFASATGEFSQCEVIYVPYLEKYARMEDDCQQCGKSNAFIQCYLYSLLRTSSILYHRVPVFPGICILSLGLPKAMSIKFPADSFVIYTEDDFKNGKLHIDIWTGSPLFNGGDDQINCENALTPDGGQTIIRNPASNYAVDCTFSFI
jgi:hypothetical protein